MNNSKARLFQRNRHPMPTPQRRGSPSFLTRSLWQRRGGSSRRARGRLEERCLDTNNSSIKIRMDKSARTASEARRSRILCGASPPFIPSLRLHSHHQSNRVVIAVPMLTGYRQRHMVATLSSLRFELYNRCIEGNFVLSHTLSVTLSVLRLTTPSANTQFKRFHF